MSVPFDPQQGLIIVRAELWGPNGSGVLRLGLDTGATGTVVNVGMLVALGYSTKQVEAYAVEERDGWLSR